MKQYKVEISIDVTAETPRKAAALGWRLLSEGPCRPVCDLFDGSGDKIRVDLEDPWDKGSKVYG